MSEASRRPDFVIVGAPKSGTTAMYEYLRAHPQLFLPERKEMRFFGADLDVRDRPTMTVDDYLASFAAAAPEQRIGTAYVWYLFSERAAAEIAAFAPGVQVIAMLRNPVEMVWSLHSEHLYNGNEDITDFTAALDAEPDRRAGRRIPPHAHLPQGLRYTEVPRYAEQLERYFDAVGRDRVRVVLYDDFARDVRAAYRDVLEFLGVDATYSPPSFAVINANKRTRSERFRPLPGPATGPAAADHSASRAGVTSTLGLRAAKASTSRRSGAPDAGCHPGAAATHVRSRGRAAVGAARPRPQRLDALTGESASTDSQMRSTCATASSPFARTVQPARWAWPPPPNSRATRVASTAAVTRRLTRVSRRELTEQDRDVRAPRLGDELGEAVGIGLDGAGLLEHPG